MSFWQRILGRQNSSAPGERGQSAAVLSEVPATPLSSTLSPDAFTQYVKRRIGDTWPEYTVTGTAPLVLTISGPRIESGTMTLDHLRTAVLDQECADSESVAVVVDDWLRRLLSPTPLDTGVSVAMREMVRPVVKSRDFVEAAAGQGLDLAQMPIAGDVVLIYAFDLGDSLRFVTRSDESALNCSSLRSLAFENLLAAGLNIQIHGPGPHVLVTCGGNFEAALLLHLPTIEAVARFYSGELVACVPTRDVLLFGCTGSPKSIDAVQAARDTLFARESAYLISRRLFVWRRGVWETFG